MFCLVGSLVVSVLAFTFYPDLDECSDGTENCHIDKNTHYSRRVCKCPQALFYNDKYVATSSVTQFNLLNHEISRARICNKKYNVQYATSLEVSPTDSCTAYS